MALFKKFLLCLIIFVIFLFISCVKKQANMVLLNGNVITMNSKKPSAEAVAIINDKIIKVGDNKEIKKLIGPETKVINLKGKTVVPGFIDAHLHFVSLGNTKKILNLVGTVSKEEIIQLVANKISKEGEEKWIFGRGWDQNDWPIKEFPTRWDLDSVSPRNPVILTRIDGHAIWVNSLVLEKAGITKETPDPQGGKIIRDPETNEPTGVLIDKAMSLIEKIVPSPSRKEKKEMVILASKECSSLGLTTIHDAGVDLETIKIYKELIKENKLTVRLYVMLGYPGKAIDIYLDKGPEIEYGNNFLTIRSIKMFADGALGSRGAALLEPYSDDPTNTGLITFDPDKALQVMIKALKKGFQICVHAIGDKANRLTLDLFERAFQIVPRVKDHRFRIEHTQVLTKEDIPRFAKLKIIPSMQPTHATSDMYWAEDRLGPERVKLAYAWKSLLDTGVRIAGGSDAPVESANPLWGIYAACTRQDHKGWPEGGWHSEQKVTRYEALKMFTIDAAYAGFEEKIKGSIEEGKLADIVVLSKDILTIPAKEILNTHVEMTIVGGKIVYQR
ncbi:amidohydrolase [Candidatus Aminicenantes bacterium AH-873-B07]|nr:amidohydrolase [Candidatus Aminicenantes bacterium AH-873-B07]